jgi:hypothetical protein
VLLAEAQQAAVLEDVDVRAARVLDQADLPSITT